MTQDGYGLRSRRVEHDEALAASGTDIGSRSVPAGSRGTATATDGPDATRSGPSPRTAQAGSRTQLRSTRPPSAPESSASAPSALKTGRALILLQVLSRGVTFALNQALVRLAPPAVFGTAAIQFDLVAATILFLSREGVRNALLRGDQSPRAGAGADSVDKSGASNSTSSTSSTSPTPDVSSSITSLAALPLRLGLLVALSTVTIYLSTSSPSTTSQTNFHTALGLYVAASLVELSIEPLYISTLRAGRLRTRVAAEGGQAIARAVVAFACLMLFPRHALLGFAVGHFAGALWLARCYVREAGVGVVPALLWPERFGADTAGEAGGAGGVGGGGAARASSTGDKQSPWGADTADAATRSLAWANTRQSVVKHVLTEADRIAVGRISPLGDQGGYAVAINYGSLVARIIFQPVEETLLLHWSRSLSSPSTLPLLTLALRLSLHLALLLPVFLPPLLPQILPLLLPRRYLAHTNAASTLQTYLACYLPLLSLNGILESFHTASAQPAEVARQAKYMVASSAAFVLSLFVLTRASSRGGTLASSLSVTTEQALIYASCAAMLVRIGYAFVHARTVARRVATANGSSLSLAQILPRASVRAAVVVSGAALWFASARLGNDASLRDRALLVLGGAAAGLAVLGTIYAAEARDVRNVGRALKQA